MTTDLHKPLSNRGDVPSPAEAEALLQFVDKDKLTALYAALGWTLDEELEMYIDLARCAPTPTVRLRALHALREVRTEIMKLSGLIAEAKVVRHEDTADGRHTSTITTQLLKKGAQIDAATQIRSPLPAKTLPADPEGDSGAGETPGPAPSHETDGDAGLPRDARDRPDPGAIPGLCAPSSTPGAPDADIPTVLDAGDA